MLILQFLQLLGILSICLFQYVIYMEIKKLNAQIAKLVKVRPTLSAADVLKPSRGAGEFMAKLMKTWKMK